MNYKLPLATPFDYRGHKVTVQPTAHPVTLAEAKAHLKVEHTADDSYITALIGAATKMAETCTNRIFTTRTILQRLDEWPGMTIYPNVVPVISVVSIKYRDANGVLQTVPNTDYDTDDTEPYRIRTKTQWPDTNNVIGNIELTYQAGYGQSASLTPEPIRHAILLIIGDMYENRQDSQRTLPTASEHLLNPYRFLTI